MDLVSRIRAIVVQIGLQGVQMLQTRGHLRFTITHFQVVPPPLDAHLDNKEGQKYWYKTVEQLRNTLKVYNHTLPVSGWSPPMDANVPQHKKGQKLKV